MVTFQKELMYLFNPLMENVEKWLDILLKCSGGTPHYLTIFQHYVCKGRINIVCSFCKVSHLSFDCILYSVKQYSGVMVNFQKELMQLCNPFMENVEKWLDILLKCSGGTPHYLTIFQHYVCKGRINIVCSFCKVSHLSFDCILYSVKQYSGVMVNFQKELMQLCNPFMENVEKWLDILLKCSGGTPHYLTIFQHACKGRINIV